ncbi:hypothetical protein WOC75_24160 [Klebsiella pneumoniae]|uniref:hypothetical protein n=1 Tax=Klebsiella pneumoniae TaxID=573 RepID=UPI0030F172C3
MLYPPVPAKGPPRSFGGSWEVAGAVGAAAVARFVTWGGPPAPRAGFEAEVAE